MSDEVKSLCLRSIIQALAGNSQESNELAEKAEKRHRHDKHLCLDIMDLIPEDVARKLKQIA